MSFVQGLKCKECGREYAKEAAYVCEFCFGPLEVAYDYDRIAGQLSRDVIMSRPRNLWRYRELLPLDLELGKVVGSLIYQPCLVAVEGNYDDVNRLCSEIASKYRWAFVNVNMRPYYTEGAKTYGFEVAEQLGWRAPDNLVCPVAGGTILPKIWKAFQEFQSLGLIPEVRTRGFAAQAEACAPVVQAIHRETDLIRPVKPRPIA